MDPIDPISRKLPLGLRMAKLASNKSTCKIKMGASLISKAGRIILAHNKIKTSPKTLEWYRFANQSHAEFNLFARMTPPISGIVSVYRQFANGEIAMARPCNSCISMLLYYGIRVIIYTIPPNGYIKENIYDNRKRKIFISCNKT